MFASAVTEGRWFRKKGPVSAVLVGVMLSSCAAALLIPAGIEFARNLLMTANKNYGSRYTNDMNQFLVRMTTPYVNMGYPGQPGMAPYGGMPGSPYSSMPGAGYPGQPGQPGVMSPGYPMQPTSPGFYDPNNPYANAPGSGFPGQPGYPGSAMPGNPYGSPPMAGGYPSQPGYPGVPGPGMPSGSSPMPGYQTQPGAPMPYDPNNPYGNAPSFGYPGQPGYPGSAMPGNPYGSPPMAGGYPSQPGYPLQPGAPYDPNNPYAHAPGSGFPGQPGYPGSAMPGNPYGAPPMAGGYPSQPGYPYGSYPGQGIYPRSIPDEPLALDVALLQQAFTATGKQVVLMKDGEALKDGGGNLQAGDKFKLVFRVNCDCFVYVISIDGSGWAQPIFPSDPNSTANPVKKDQEYSFPEGPNWFTLDRYRGIETIMLVASPVRRVDLEESFTQLAKAQRPSGSVSAQVEEPPIIPNGFGKMQSGQATKVRSVTGEQVEVTPTTYIASKPGEEVRVTRWFKHE